MTKEEARLFFAVPAGVEPEEFYEEQLFEYKQFFLSKAPIRKVFLSKLEKLKQMDNAFRTQEELEMESYLQVDESPVAFPDNILSAFQLFEKEKGKFKLQLMSAFDAKSIYVAVVNYLSVIAGYREKWQLPEGQELAYDGNVSKEADPMEILSEIRAFKEQGGEEFKDVIKIGSNSFLLNEMKRVSLLNKNYGG